MDIKKPPSDIFVRWRPDHQIPSETLAFPNPEQATDSNVIMVYRIALDKSTAK